MKSLKEKERRGSDSPEESSPQALSFSRVSPRGNVLACLTSTLLLLAWLHLFFLQPLEQEAIDMHRRQLDPTEIVVVPYDATRLFLFVSGTAFARVLLQSQQSVVSQLVRLVSDAAVAVGAMVLCGASPTADLSQTACAAAYLALLATTLPPHLSLPQPQLQVASSNDSNKPGSLSLIQRLSQASHSFQSPPEVLGRQNISYEGVVALCVVGLNVPFSILRLYDRGWQWQRWPVPVVVATTYGWVLASVLGLGLRFHQESACIKPKTRKENAIGTQDRRQ